MERVAILPIENLSGDPSLDWVSVAIPAILTRTLAAASSLSAVEAANVRDAYAAGATTVLQGYLQRSGATLSLQLVNEDLSTHQIRRTFTRTAAGNDVIAAAESLARDLDQKPHSFGYQNAYAVRSWGTALTGSDRRQQLETAISQDPRFGPAYVALAADLARTGDRSGVDHLRDAAREKGADRLSLAELDLISATLQQDVAGRGKALEELAASAPSNPQYLRELAVVRYNARDFAKAAELYKSAVRFDPSNMSIVNLLGYAQAYAGDLPGATKTLQDYMRRGDEANGLDSLGEVHFGAGKFAEAEAYFLRASDRDPARFGASDLLKAAQARLLRGDARSADDFIRRYLEMAKQNPDHEVTAACWDWMAGRQDQAIRRLEPLAYPNARAELALLALERGDRAKAASYAAQIPPSNLSSLFRFLTQPPPADGWPAAANKLIPDPRAASIRDNFLAYALFFDKQYAEAVPVLWRVYEATDPSADGLVRTLLAEALVKTNQRDKAAPLLARYPLAFNDADGAFTPIILSHFTALRK